MDSLRIEKSYKYWRADLSTEYSAWESGLDRFVHLNKGEFIGREALVRQQQQGVPRKFVTLEVRGQGRRSLGQRADLCIGKKMVGRTTSGAYGYTVGKSLAVGYVKADAAQPGTEAQDPDARQEAHRPHRRGLAVGSGECKVESVDYPARLCGRL